jgi:putative ABC transport system ATP-binding protein
MLQALNRDEGITIVIVTHDPTVAGYAGRIVHMTDGQIESDVPAAAAPSAGAHA